MSNREKFLIISNLILVIIIIFMGITIFNLKRFVYVQVTTYKSLNERFLRVNKELDELKASMPEDMP